MFLFDEVRLLFFGVFYLHLWLHSTWQRTSFWEMLFGKTNPVLKKIGSKQLPSTSDLQSCNPSIHQPTNQPSNQTTNSIFNWIWIKSEARFWAPLCLAEFRPQRGWRKGFAESLHAGLREWDQGYLTGMVRHNVGPPKTPVIQGTKITLLLGRG